MEKHVAIIILNWNGLDVTLECLKSLRQIDYQNYNIVLVDSGSTDGSAANFKSLADQKIDLICLKENLGFTGGNNRGISFAKEKYDPDFFLLLNNDTIVERDFLKELVLAFDRDSNCYASVPKIFYFNSGKRLWFAGGHVSRVTGVVKHYGINKLDEPKFNISGKIGFMNGCSALISKEGINNIGLLDDRFFANSEDADFSLRILNAGHTIQYAPKAVIYHKVSYSFEANRGKWLSFYLAARGIVQLQKKHLSGFYFLLFLFVFAVRWVAYLVVKLLILRDIKSVRGVFVGVFDGLNNKLRYVSRA